MDKTYDNFAIEIIRKYGIYGAEKLIKALEKQVEIKLIKGEK